MNDMPRPNLFSLGPESCPVEASPVTELQINQYRENNQDSAGYEDALSIHVVGEDPSNSVAPSKAPTQGKKPEVADPRYMTPGQGSTHPAFNGGCQTLQRGTSVRPHFSTSNDFKALPQRRLREAQLASPSLAIPPPSSARGWL